MTIRVLLSNSQPSARGTRRGCAAGCSSRAPLRPKRREVRRHPPPTRRKRCRRRAPCVRDATRYAACSRRAQQTPAALRRGFPHACRRSARSPRASWAPAYPQSAGRAASCPHARRERSACSSPSCPVCPRPRDKARTARPHAPCRWRRSRPRDGSGRRGEPPPPLRIRRRASPPHDVPSSKRGTARAAAHGR